LGLSGIGGNVVMKATMPGALPSKGCEGCNPYEKCLPCEYRLENGGQCGGCHVFFIDEDQSMEESKT